MLDELFASQYENKNNCAEGNENVQQRIVLKVTDLTFWKYLSDIYKLLNKAFLDSSRRLFRFEEESDSVVGPKV